MIMLALIVIFMSPARAADPTDLLSSDDLSDTLIGMIHYHGIAHVMSAVAAALPIAASLPDAHDCRSRSASSHTAILTAIATIAAFAATLASSPAEPSDADSHEHDHETPSWLLDAADTLERTSDRSGSDSDDDSIDDSHVNKPETSITPNPPNTTVIDQKYRGVTTHLNSGVLRGVIPDSTLDPRFDSHDDLSLTDGATHDGVLNDLGPNNDADHRGVMPDLLMINSSEPSLVSSIIEPKPKLIEPKPKLIMNDDDDDEPLPTHVILPLHATPRYITIDDSITLQSRMIHEDIQGWDISIVQHGFSKAPYGSARHQRRLKWGSYDV